MKAKEEKIREAWNRIGVNFPIGICMETGYSEVQNENDISKILEYHNISVTDIEWQHINPAGLRYRPKSLQGIENNNGWIKIESEDDLPKGKATYWTIDKFMEVNPTREFFDPEAIVSMNERWMSRITHYQPTNIPLKPIY